MELLDRIDRQDEAFNITTLALKVAKQALKQDPENMLWRRDAYHLQVYMLALKTDTSYSDIKRELVDLESEIKQDNILTELSRQELSGLLYLAASRQLEKNGNYSAASAYVTQSIAVFEKLHEKSPKKVSYLINVSDGEILKASLLKASNPTDIMVSEYCQKVATRLSSFIEKDKRPGFVMPYLKSLDCLDDPKTARQLFAELKARGYPKLDGYQ
ncbi:hypothetical protein [Shewanella algae]|uniref:hypothetical protein n=1 Tax=Shewanella algae TaxID=38313 RepID=UPI00214BF15C|nr:hypothetical protein [Shewanella algae]